MPFADALTLAEFTGDDSLNSARGDLLLDAASAIIRNHCRQTLDLVANDEAELRGTHSTRLLLPERPVVDVSAVTVNGVEASGWRRVRDGLWRSDGWGGSSTLIEVTYTHGFAEDTPVWETLKAVCLAVAARAAANPQHFQSINVDGVSGVFGMGPSHTNIGLTAAEQAILDRFRHERATA